MLQKVDAVAPQREEQQTPSPIAGKQVICREGVRLNQTSVSKEEAIQAAGELLVQLGYVDESYIPAMQEREKLITTYMGMGVAIPHGTSQAKGTVKKTGIVFLQYPDGVKFGEEKAQLVFGIAGIGNEHMDLLAKIQKCGFLGIPYDRKYGGAGSDTLAAKVLLSLRRVETTMLCVLGS